MYTLIISVTRNIFMTTEPHLILVDGSSYIFRAYHALPPLTRKSDGLPVGAVSGFCNMLWKLLQDSSDEIEDPTHIAVIFDASGDSFRNDFYPEYKANRDAPPEDLRPQFKIIREAVRAFNVSCIEKTGFEADDIIATYVELAKADGVKVTIVASDKDLMQLVSDDVHMYDTMKNKRFGPEEVIEKFGVAADKVIDVQALAGDSVDNVPGVPGIGIKTAAQLINEYGDLEKLLEGAPNIKQKKRRENLIEFAEQARISMRLVKLAKDVEDLPQLNDLTVIERDSRELVAFLKEMEFTTLTRRVATILDVDASEISPSSRLDLSEIMPERLTKKDEQDDKNDSGDALTPQKKALQTHEELSLIALDHSKYETVRDLDALARWVNLITQKGYVAFDSETSSLNAMEADIIGFSLSVKPGEACYIPVGHQNGDGLLCERTPDQLTLEQVFSLLKPVLEDKSITIIGQNLKYDWLVLANHGVHINAMDDTMLMSYALDACLGGYGMDALAERHLDLKPISYSEVAGKGKAQINFSQVDIESAT